MTGRERIAAGVIHALGALWVSTAATVSWLIVSALARGTLLPLPALNGAAAAYAVVAAAAGAAHLYTGTQVMYSMPGWHRSGAALLLGDVVAGAVVAHQVSIAAGASLSAVGAAGAFALYTVEQDRSVDSGDARNALLAVSSAFLAVPVILLSLSSSALPGQWARLMPDSDPAVAEAVRPLLSGQLDHVHLTPGDEGTARLPISELIASSEPALVASIGSTDLETCAGWGAQTNGRLDRGNLRLLRVAGTSDPSYDFWVQRDGVRARAPSGETPFRSAHVSSMLPYVPAARDLALAGGPDQHPGLCTLLHSLPYATELIDQDPRRLLLAVRPADAERAARVGEAARQHQARLTAGWPPVIAAIATATRTELPDLRTLTAAPRTLTLTREQGRLRSLTIRTGDGGTVTGVIVFEEAAITPPELPDPEGVRAVAHPMSRLLSPVQVR